MNYLDNVSTTKPDDAVIEAMIPYYKEGYGNPSNLHQKGLEARSGVTWGREQVAKLINAATNEIFFTASGSESNNMAIKGATKALEKKGKHVVTSVIEHYSIYNCVKYLEKLGYEVTSVGVDHDGQVDPEAIRAAIRPDTVLVSIQHANPEMGAVQDIAAIGTICKEKGVLFHTDAVLTAGTIPVDVTAMNVDIMSMSAHQFYGPKGVGALYIRKGVRVLPLVEGGTQESGRRAGTENVPGIVGMGKAAEIAMHRMTADNERFTQLRDRLAKGLTAAVSESFLTGGPKKRLPGHASFIVEYIEGESMLLLLDMQGIMCSSGSACTSHALKESYVLHACGYTHASSNGSLVFSLGRDTTEADVDQVIAALPPIVERLRLMSPLFNRKEPFKEDACAADDHHHDLPEE